MAGDKLFGSFKNVQIGDVCLVGDGAHAKVKRISAGVPYLTSKNIGIGRLKLDKYDCISASDFERLFTEDSSALSRLRQGDLLTGIIGTFGNAYLYRQNDFFGVSSAIAVIRPRPHSLDSRYLYYVVTSERFKRQWLLQCERSFFDGIFFDLGFSFVFFCFCFAGSSFPDSPFCFE